MPITTLLRKGEEFMFSETTDPNVLALILSHQEQTLIEVVACLHRSVPGLEWPLNSWVKGDEDALVRSLLTTSLAIDIWSVLETCKKEEADTAALCKKALYDKFGKATMRPIVAKETVEKTTTVAGYYKKVLMDNNGRCLRVRK
jgi:hypothetical protein